MVGSSRRPCTSRGDERDEPGADHRAVRLVQVPAERARRPASAARRGPAHRPSPSGRAAPARSGPGRRARAGRTTAPPRPRRRRRSPTGPRRPRGSAVCGMAGPDLDAQRRHRAARQREHGVERRAVGGGVVRAPAGRGAPRRVGEHAVDARSGRWSGRRRAGPRPRGSGAGSRSRAPR